MGNDVTIIAGILFTLIALGLVMPIFKGPLGLGVSTVNKTEITNSSAAGWTGTSGSIADTGAGAISMFESLIDAIFWYYEEFPVWLTSIHVGVRLLLGLLIYRQLRSGGG